MKNKKQNKKILDRIFLYIAISIVIILTLGLVLSIYYSFVYNFKSYQYGDSFDVQVELQTTNDGKLITTSDPTKNSTSELTDAIKKQTITALSNYLQTKGIETYNKVKFIEKEIDDVPHYYVQATIPYDYSDNGYINIKNQFISTDDGKTRNSWANEMFEDISSNRISFVLDKKTNEVRDSSNRDAGQTCIISQEDICNSSNRVSLVKSTTTKSAYDTVITTPINSTDSTITNSVWKDLMNGDNSPFKSTTTSSGYGDDIPNAEIYIIKDQESLINRMKYILQTCSAYSWASADQNKNDPNAIEYKKAYTYLSQSERDWAYNILKKSNDSSFDVYKYYASKLFNATSDDFDKYQFYNHSSGYFINKWTDNSTDSTINDNSTWQNDCSSLFYKLIDIKPETEIYDPSSNSGALTLPGTIDSPGTINYGWLKKYVLGVITKDNWKTFFPNKNPNNSTDKPNDDNYGKWIVINQNTYYEANILKHCFIDYSFPTPIKRIITSINSDGSPDYSNNKGGFVDSSLFGVTQNQKLFKNTIFNLDPLIAQILTLFFMVLLIGILVSIFYRIPGFFATLTLCVTIGFTLLILILTSHPLSFGLFMGIIAGIILYTFGIFLFFGKLHKQSISNSVLKTSYKKTISKTLLPIIDISIIGVIFSICLMYLGPLTTLIFSETFLIFNLLSICTFSLFFLLNYFVMCNNMFLNSQWLVFSKRKLSKQEHFISDEMLNEENKNYETTFISRKPNEKIDFFHKKGNIVALCILCLLSLCGILAYIFLNDLINKFNFALISIETKLLIAMIVSTAALSIYSIIRQNWSSFVPTIISLIFSFCILSPLLYMSGKDGEFFNETIIIVSTLYIINATFIFTFIDFINNKWVKTQNFDIKKLKYIISHELFSNIWHYFIYIIIIVFGIFGLELLFNTKSLLIPLIYPIIDVICISFILLVITKYLLLLFIRLKIKYAVRVSQNDFFFNKNFDKVDEQNIEGINKHKKKKIVL